jgi:XRE family transcriptional regulator, aerobic/anaerobic benzoate catabolism transcriptional regulator
MTSERHEPDATPRDALLTSLGERVRTLRARAGLTRRALATSSGVSERHLANMELGMGNASVRVLAQIAAALDCPVTQLLTEEDGSSPERMLIGALLQGRPEDDLTRARLALADLFGESGSHSTRLGRVALIGLRGAGKSTLGQMLAEAKGVPFVELTREIERVAGCSVNEIQNLLGQGAYRRYARRALEDVLAQNTDVVIATTGGLVSDVATYKLLLSQCLTVWLKASPDEHMQRVVAQGDLRPMSGNREAMDDLKRILASRTPLYAKAQITLETSGRALEANFEALRGEVERAQSSAL